MSLIKCCWMRSIGLAKIIDIESGCLRGRKVPEVYVLILLDVFLALILVS